MAYDPTPYRTARDAFVAHVRTLLWRDPSAELGIAYRPADDPRGPALATFSVNDRDAVADGYRIAHGGPIPQTLDDQRLADWVQEVTRRLPIIPASAYV